ncbi:MAG: DUF2268 domain-containing protein [bacterium]|nr:DUF2268 domain-containing protein [bacterium]
MEQIVVKEIRSDEAYRKIMLAPADKKEDVYRYDFMKAFEKKWEMYHCPLKAKQEGGYDVVMASGMLGYLTPKSIDMSYEPMIDMLSDQTFWKKCKESIEKTLHCFEEHGIELPVREYLFTVTLGDPESPYCKLCDNYSGDGGIPGYIFGSLVPSAYTLSRMPVALSHEAAHNVRFQFIKWSQDITLGEYIICEGLAENFATTMYGYDQVGPWVTKTSEETLNDYIKPLMKDALLVQGFDNITAYMYGDELALMQNYIPAGMPYCAGYACGYHLVKYYLEKTGTDITDATILPAQEILDAVPEFWEIKTTV